MKLDPTTTRLLGRITDRMDLVRKNPHRYEIDAEVLKELAEAARREAECLGAVVQRTAGVTRLSTHGGLDQA